MLDNTNALDSALKGLPRRSDAPDIVETVYDPDLVPYIVALVANKKLRAAFLHESEEQKSLRLEFAAKTCTPEFWDYMHARNHMHSTKPFRVGVSPDQVFKSHSLDRSPIPAFLVKEMREQARLLDASFSSFETTDTLIFTSRDQGGTFAMHQDGNYVTLHKTLAGHHGMTYMTAPISAELEQLSYNRRAFRAIFEEDSSLTNVIPTGTLSIFGTNFYHASSGVESVSVGSVLGDDCVPIKLTHDYDS